MKLLSGRSGITAQARVRVLIGIIATFGCQATYCAPILTPEEYHQERDVSLQIIGGQMPKDVFILGPGRSPYPFIQFWKNYLPGSAIGFPLSGFRYQASVLPPWGEALSTYQPYPSRAAAQSHYPLPAVEEKRLFEYFDSVVPSPQVLGEKTLEVIDYGRGGTSLFGITSYLRKYLKARNRNNIVEPVLVTLDENLERVRYYINATGETVRLITVSVDSPLGNKLKNQSNDSISPYGKYDIKSNVYNPPESENSSKQFEAELKLYMASDGSLPPGHLRAETPSNSIVPIPGIHVELASPTITTPNPNAGKDVWEGRTPLFSKDEPLSEALVKCLLNLIPL